ncbi:hypothetical protein [Streptomyces iconiensis]|uniref:Uncharacterized protein n=1 Tax=Streptomyces iconiensis TaxID=1384038 RepID=A0ABT7A2B5_9ACTN|nr:hypothetical protein [Streptomyces iconiensis]MDJ1135460.1 hypothetical protein [Streptomyces iconiensis]
MRPATTSALQEWASAYTTSKDAAARALAVAFRPYHLTLLPPEQTTCCSVQLLFLDGDTGRICVDAEERVTINLFRLPAQVLAEALDNTYGVGWLDGVHGPLALMPPDRYSSDDEVSSAE